MPFYAFKYVLDAPLKNAPYLIDAPRESPRKMKRK